jgi:FtsP/CotA-like multicopper oxidase with cupredoxin domain
VQITSGPTLELARGDSAIIRWVCNNPGGTDGHVAIVQYGTDPKNLSKTASSPMVVNRTQQLSTFRVMMNGLTPGTTYYYTVTSTESSGASDGVQSPVSQFTMPGAG